MQKSIVVNVTFGARHNQLSHIGIGRPVYKRMVRLTGNHQVYLHTGVYRHHQRRIHRLIRYKIGRLDVYPLLRLVDKTDIIVPHRLQRSIRSAVDNLHPAAVPAARLDSFHVLGLGKQIFLRRIIPVQQKPKLQPLYRLAPDAQVGIPPIAEFRVQSDIFLAYIEAPYIAHLIVNHHNFPMVAVINTQMQAAQQDWEKFRRLNALCVQLPPVAFPH